MIGAIIYFFVRIYEYERYKRMCFDAVMAKIKARYEGEDPRPYEIAYRYARRMKYKFSK